MDAQQKEFIAHKIAQFKAKNVQPTTETPAENETEDDNIAEDSDSSQAEEIKKILENVIQLDL